MVDLYCKDKKCPICGNRMKHLRDDSLLCVNNCYGVQRLERRTDLDIFGKIYVFSNTDSEKMQFFKSLIEYWKENDRYLAEILSRE